jgi:DNA-binding GntR family transcriptional regulator
MSAAPAPAWWNSPTETPAGDRGRYLVARDHIARQIHSGALKPGAKLPSERQLQDGLGVARGTIREALFQLESEGMIFRRDRSGWYVSPEPVTYDPTRWAGFMTYVSEQGRQPATETLSTASVEAQDGVAKAMGLPLVERIYVEAERAPDLLAHDLDGSLTQILKSRYRLAVTRNRVEMQPCALIQEEAEALGVKSGTPGLLVIRASFDAAGRIVEYDHEYWRHDALRVKVDLDVTP